MRSVCTSQYDSIGFCYIASRERTINDIIRDVPITDRPHVLLFNAFTSRVQFIGDMCKMRSLFQPEVIICRRVTSPSPQDLRLLIGCTIAEVDEDVTDSITSLIHGKYQHENLPGYAKVIRLLQEVNGSFSDDAPSRIDYEYADPLPETGRVMIEDDKEYHELFQAMADMGRDSVRAETLYRILGGVNQHEEAVAEVDHSNSVHIERDNGVIRLPLIPSEEVFLQFTLEELEEIVKYTSYLCGREVRYNALACSACNALARRR
jgi:hypothetical protein